MDVPPCRLGSHSASPAPAFVQRFVWFNFARTKLVTVFTLTENPLLGYTKSLLGHIPPEFGSEGDTTGHQKLFRKVT